MNFVHSLWQRIKLLFCIKTGFGCRDTSISADSEAFAAIFLPFFGLIVGSVAALAAFLMQSIGFYTASVVVGLAVLVALGRFKHLSTGSKIILTDKSAAKLIIPLLILLFEVLALIDIIGKGSIPLAIALLYMPVVETIAMLSAASVLGEDELIGSPLSAVKGWHMLLSSLLALVLMIPQFGMISIVYISVSIFAGSMTTIVVIKANKKEMATNIAAIVSNLLYLLCLMLLTNSKIYY